MRRTKHLIEQELEWQTPCPHLAASGKRTSFASSTVFPATWTCRLHQCYDSTLLHSYISNTIQKDHGSSHDTGTSGAIFTLPFTFASFAYHRMQVRLYVCILRCDSAANPGSEHHRSRNDTSKVTLSAPSQPRKRACVSVASYE